MLVAQIYHVVCLLVVLLSLCFCSLGFNSLMLEIVLDINVIIVLPLINLSVSLHTCPAYSVY